MRTVAQLKYNLPIQQIEHFQLISRLDYNYARRDAHIHALNWFLQMRQMKVFFHDIIQIPNLDRFVHGASEN